MTFAAPFGRRALLMAGTSFPLPALPQGVTAWPARPIRAIVSFPPGGAIDTVTRLIAPAMGETLGQPLVIENRAGATGTLAAGVVAQASPDGHTLLFDASTHASAQFLVRNLPFDYSTAFAPVTRLTTVPIILVAHPAIPATTIDEFLALGRSRAVMGQPLAYGSSGNGSASHYASVLFLQRAGWEATHIPFRGGGPAVQALLAGTVQWHMGSAATSTALAQEGRLRALAVTTLVRMASLPQVPTLAESGMPGFEWIEWGGIFAPVGTPAPVLARVQIAAGQALAQAAVRERLTALGMLPVGDTSAEFAAWLAGQRALVGRLTREAAVTLD
jgi:tripartite-type tricarboxylate transporter receptor subunit TctC